MHPGTSVCFLLYLPVDMVISWPFFSAEGPTMLFIQYEATANSAISLPKFFPQNITQLFSPLFSIQTILLHLLSLIEFWLWFLQFQSQVQFCCRSWTTLLAPNIRFHYDVRLHCSLGLPVRISASSLVLPSWLWREFITRASQYFHFPLISVSFTTLFIPTTVSLFFLLSFLLLISLHVSSGHVFVIRRL